MKLILLLTGVFTLLATTGCLVTDGGRHSRHGHHSEAVIVGPPVVVVPVPVVVVHPR